MNRNPETIRDRRELVIRGFLHDLAADYGLWMPRLLDELERLDGEHAGQPAAPSDVTQIDPRITEEARALAEAAGQTPKRAAPARTTARRRTARKAAGS